MWAVLSTYGLSHGLGAQIAGYIAIFVSVWIATQFVGCTTMSGALGYGLGFTVVHIGLDALVMLPTIGFAVFFTPFVWIGYFIVFITPPISMFYSRQFQRNTTDITATTQ